MDADVKAVRGLGRGWGCTRQSRGTAIAEIEKSEHIDANFAENKKIEFMKK